MKIFRCNHCQQPVFFENFLCVQCGSQLAYLPDQQWLGSLEPKSNGLWRLGGVGTADKMYRLCQNYIQHNNCNWAVPADDPNPLCASCRLTGVLPDLNQPGNREAWFRLEAAKRRLVYTLHSLRLPVLSKAEDPEGGLTFAFVADIPGQEPSLTGHDGGIITINIAEADDAVREKRRTQLHEPYRTLLGHLRHESGHYYWDRLIRDSPHLEPFRELFGDERDDYSLALQRHYQQGAPGGWQDRFVTAYASSHPWEDWAETWAHYLHISDTLETAAACGLSLNPGRPNEPSLDTNRRRDGYRLFERMIQDWFPVTYLLNHLNRGLGLADAYPFVLPPPAIEKLRFVHGVIHPAL